MQDGQVNAETMAAVTQDLAPPVMAEMARQLWLTAIEKGSTKSRRPGLLIRNDMGYKSLQHFVKVLDKAGELVRIKEPVSPNLEITEITDRVNKKFGPALLFENVPGYDMPVLMNAFGSMKRMCLALEVKSLGDIAAEILSFLEAEAPDTLIKKLKMLPKLARLGNIFPKDVSRAPCQEIILRDDEVDLTKIPVLTCWPGDGGPFVTLPLVFTHHPETGKRNLGMYRLQVFDKHTTGMHWHRHKGGAQHYRVAERRGERLPVAVAIGADPATIYAATAPLPEDLDEMIFAGFLRQEPVEMVQCVSVPLRCRPAPRSCWRVMWSRGSGGWRGPSGTTPAIIPCRTSTRCFTSPP